MFYCYIYLDPRKFGDYKYYIDVNCESFELEFDFEPFYVGKGMGSRCFELVYGRSVYFKNKINKIKKEGFELIVQKIYENIDESLVFKFEKELISIIGKYLDKIKGPLINVSDGGPGLGMSGENHPWWGVKLTREEAMARLGGEKNGMYGKHHSDEACEAISKAMTKRNLIDNPMHRPEVVAKITGSNNPMHGRSWCNNGVINKCLYELPGEDWKWGRLPWGRNPS